MHPKVQEVYQKLTTSVRLMCELTEKIISEEFELSDEEFLQHLKKLNVWFHNFKALDAKCKYYGFDFIQDAEARELVVLFQSRNKLLQDRLDQRTIKARKDLTIVSEGRKRLAKFRSGAEDLTAMFLSRV